MKLLKFLIVAITMFSVATITPTTEAAFKTDPVLTAEYYANPDNYFSGSGIGTGAIRKYRKNTLKIENYAPPHYTISIDVVWMNYKKEINNYVVTGSCTERFYYNWETKKAYREMINHDKGGQLEWQEITNNFRNEKGIANDIFKLAYNIDFFSPNELKP